MNQTQDRPTDPGTDPGPQFNRSRFQDVGRLRRSRDDRYVAGVAGGLGRHFGIDPTIIRVVLVATCIFGGAGLLFYGALWLFVPEDGQEQAPIHMSEDTLRIVLLVVAAVAAVSVIGNPWWGFGGSGTLWVGGIVAIVIAAVLTATRRHDGTQQSSPAPAPAGTTTVTADVPVAPEQQAMAFSADAPPAPPAQTPPVAATPAPAPAPSPRRPRRTGMLLFWPTLAIMLVGFGALGIYAEHHHVIPSAWPALALAVIGLMLVIGAFVGRPGGLIFLGLITIPPMLALSLVENFHWESKSLNYTPTSAATVQDSYTIGNGQMTIDLSKVTDPAQLQGKVIDARMDIGEIVVYVPRDVSTTVTGSLNVAGDVEIGGREQSGFSPDVTTTLGTSAKPVATFELDVHGHLGHIEVRTR